MGVDGREIRLWRGCARFIAGFCPRKREQAAFAGNATVFLVTVYVAVWLGGAALLSISVVAPRRARSVLAWMRTGKPSATQVNSARPSLRG